MFPLPDMRLDVGLNPTMPQNEAGIRMDPATSEQAAMGTHPMATNAASPPDEPPGVRSKSHGFLRNSVGAGPSSSCLALAITTSVLAASGNQNCHIISRIQPCQSYQFPCVECRPVGSCCLLILIVVTDFVIQNLVFFRVAFVSRPADPFLVEPRRRAWTFCLAVHQEVVTVTTVRVITYGAISVKTFMILYILTAEVVAEAVAMVTLCIVYVYDVCVRFKGMHQSYEYTYCSSIISVVAD
jgi:hypothetical protein